MLNPTLRKLSDQFNAFMDEITKKPSTSLHLKEKGTHALAASVGYRKEMAYVCEFFNEQRSLLTNVSTSKEFLAALNPLVFKVYRLSEGSSSWSLFHLHPSAQFPEV